MAIEQLPGGGTSITGPDIPVFALLTLAHALALEINHPGMQASRIPALTGAKNLGVIPKDKRGNKKQALKLTVQKLREVRPDYEPSDLIVKALIK